MRASTKLSTRRLVQRFSSTTPAMISCADSPLPRRASRGRRPRPSARNSSADLGAISCTPVMVETGAATLAVRDDGRRVPPSAVRLFCRPEAKQRLRSLSVRRRAGRKRSPPPRASEWPHAEMNWRRRASPGPSGRARSKSAPTGLISTGWSNTWLPSQLYASRLFGRVGPNQLGGATGYRDQLQDVLPLTLLEPRLTRAQIVLAREPAIPRRRCAQVVASRAWRRHRSRPANQGERPASR